MRAVVALACALALSGCGGLDRTTAKWTGYAKTCVDGVSYIQFTSGAVKQEDINGKNVPC